MYLIGTVNPYVSLDNFFSRLMLMHFCLRSVQAVTYTIAKKRTDTVDILVRPSLDPR